MAKLFHFCGFRIRHKYESQCFSVSFERNHLSNKDRMKVKCHLCQHLAYRITLCLLNISVFIGSKKKRV